MAKIWLAEYWPAQLALGMGENVANLDSSTWPAQYQGGGGGGCVEGKGAAAGHGQ